MKNIFIGLISMKNEISALCVIMSITLFFSTYSMDKYSWIEQEIERGYSAFKKKTLQSIKQKLKEQSDVNIEVPSITSSNKNRTLLGHVLLFFENRDEYKDTRFQKEVVQLLLEQGADVNHKSVHPAGKVCIIKLLLSAGIDPNKYSVDSYSQKTVATGLTSAVIYEDHCGNDSYIHLFLRSPSALFNVNPENVSSAYSWKNDKQSIAKCPKLIHRLVTSAYLWESFSSDRERVAKKNASAKEIAHKVVLSFKGFVDEIIQEAHQNSVAIKYDEKKHKKHLIAALEWQPDQKTTKIKHNNNNSNE